MSQFSNIRVLLIDDDKDFGSITQAFAKAKGMQIDWLPSLDELPGEKALDDYGLVLIDYILESDTGIHVAKDLFKIVPDLPVVLVSATDRPEYEKGICPKNVVGFITKWQESSSVVDQIAEQVQKLIIEKTLMRAA